MPAKQQQWKQHVGRVRPATSAIPSLKKIKKIIDFEVALHGK